MPNQQNDLLQAYIAREPAGPRQRDIATLKAAVFEYAAKQPNRSKTLIDFVKLLVAAEKSRAADDRLAGRTVEQPQLAAAQSTFFGAYQLVAGSAPQSTLFLDRFCRKFAQFQPPESTVFDWAWRGLLTPEWYPGEIAEDHEIACAAFRPAKQHVIAERDFYIANDSPDRAAYESLLAGEPAGQLRELIALSKLFLDKAQSIRDSVIVCNWSKLVNLLYKQQAGLAVANTDLWGVSDIAEVGGLLATLFNRDFVPDAPGWADQIGERLADAIREQTDEPHDKVVALFVRLLKLSTESRSHWHSDAANLVQNFPAAIRLAMNGADKNGLLDAFCGGAARYPLATRSAG